MRSNDHEAEDTIHIGGFLYKVALKLLGVLTLAPDVSCPFPLDPDAAPAWVDASKYLVRIQSTPQQKLQILNRLADFLAWVTTCKEELRPP